MGAKERQLHWFKTGNWQGRLGKRKGGRIVTTVFLVKGGNVINRLLPRKPQINKSHMTSSFPELSENTLLRSYSLQTRKFSCIVQYHHQNRKFTFIYYHHLVLRPHSILPVVPIMSFTSKGSVQIHAFTCQGSSFPPSEIVLQSFHNFHDLDPCEDYRPVLLYKGLKLPLSDNSTD